MKLIRTNQLSKEQKLQIFEIWNNEYPAKIGYKDISEFEAYLEKLADQHHILALDSAQSVKGWFFDFIREEDRWFAIILDSSLQGKGIGSKILDLAKSINTVLNAWVTDHNTDLKKNGEPYLSPLQFYVKNGFEVLTEVRVETDILSAVKIRWTKD
ncbi:N-acetyltransferase [Roseivirga sp.]|uniref:N-acetyltransferase n=1 Tax=Roseivirga sp. TaxID=1964215 RepID=UPI003B528BF6